MGGGSALYSTHKGIVRLEVLVNELVEMVTLLDVLFVPGWKSVSLISWRQIAVKKMYSLGAQDNWMGIFCLKTHKAILNLELNSGLYQLSQPTDMAYKASFKFWHSALGHSHPRSSFDQNVYCYGGAWKPEGITSIRVDIPI